MLHGAAPGYDLETYRRIYRSQLLGRYKLWGPDLVTDDSAFDHPDKFDEGGTWVPTNVTMSDAHTLRETAATDYHKLTYSGMLTAAGPQSQAVIVVPDGREWVLLSTTAGPCYVWYHLTGAGALGTQTAGVGAIADATPYGVPGGYLCTITPANLAAGADFRIYPAKGDGLGNTSYAGDTGKGLKLYNAQIEQTSILTAPNDPTLAARNLALYGNPYHFTNPNKDSQLVVGADVWDGLPGAIASGANWIACDEMAPRLMGNDVPVGVVLAGQLTAVPPVQATFWSAGHAAGLDRYQSLVWQNAVGLKTEKRGVGGAQIQNTTLPLPDTDRHIFAHQHFGTTESLWLDSVATSVANAASDAETQSLNQVSLAVLRRSTLTYYLTGVLRDALFIMSATGPQMIAASHIMRAENP
jgi:hypothetical protein